MTQANNKLHMMAMQAKKLYKVIILEEAVSTVRVWATDPEQAADLVIKQGQGTHDGRVGPEVAGVKVEEVGATDDQAAVIENAQTESDPKVKGLIEVIRS